MAGLAPETLNLRGVQVQPLQPFRIMEGFVSQSWSLTPKLEEKRRGPGNYFPGLHPQRLSADWPQPCEASAWLSTWHEAGALGFPGFSTPEAFGDFARRA
jgi:hypothetical protein